MKRAIFALALVLSVPFFVFAQTAAPSQTDDLSQEVQYLQALLSSIFSHIGGSHQSAAVAAAFSPYVGLVADYRFNDGTGTTAADSALKNAGTITGATWVTGVSGTALAFGSVGSRVTITQTTSLNPSTRTISFWANPSSLRYYSVVYEDTAGDYGGFNGMGQLRVNWKDASNTSRASNITANATAGTWQLFTVVYDPSGSSPAIRVYRNGVLTGSAPLTGGFTPNPISLIGGRKSSDTEYFGGALDEFRIYDRAMSDSDVQGLYATSITAGNIGPAPVVTSVPTPIIPSKPISPIVPIIVKPATTTVPIIPTVPIAPIVPKPATTTLPTKLPATTTPPIAPTFAGTYYVDYSSGSDTNTGTSQTLAWKHAPGDPNATGKPLAVKLTPGTTVLFKGGVRYPGQIAIPASGTASSPIVYNGSGWGSQKAIIDGQDPVTDWTRCSSAADCAGNPNWQHIYHSAITIPPVLVGKQFEIRLNVLQGDQVIIPAQFPESTSRYYQENDNYYSVPPSKVTPTTITDPRLAALGGANLVGSYVYVWAQANDIFFEKITAYNSSTNTITFSSAVNPYPDRNTVYAIANNPGGSIFREAGEYYMSPKANPNGTYNLYVWPLANANLAASPSISIGERPYGFLTGNQSYVTIEGFLVRGQAGDDIRSGFGIYRYYAQMVSGLKILNNEVELTMGDDAAAISFSPATSILIDGNYVHDTLGNQRGIVVGGGSGNIVSNNHLDNIARTGIYLQGVVNSKILNNFVENSNSTHGNGISTYVSDDHILVQGNKVVNSNIAFTMETSSNITVNDNLFDGSNATSNVFADWGGMTGTNIVTNNTIVGSTGHNALLLSSFGKGANYVVTNNIIDGGGSSALTAGAFTNNVYVGLTWNQTPQYKWSLGQGESVSTPAAVFTNPAASLYTLKPGSPAKGKGFQF